MVFKICSKIGHLARCCNGKKVTPGTSSSGKVTAVEKVEEIGAMECFAFFIIVTVPTFDKFEPLAQLNSTQKNGQVFPHARLK